MTFLIWLQFATVCTIGAMSPGPSLAIVIRNNIQFNRTAGILTSLGHGLGIGVYALMAVIGLGFILQTSTQIFLLIQIIGLIFLFFLGFTYLKQKETNEKIENNQKQINSFMQGFLIAIINPKILIWFTAIYSQFLLLQASFAFNATLVLTASIIDALWYILVSILVTSYGLKNILIEKKLLIQKITGLILILISLSLLYNVVI
ncbi:LysE family translocator [Alphaproteobacteria bacterium]|nr:LysE family translocator [Alphaproteobacteria bacterium]